MENGSPFFWMNGILATDLLEVSSDATRLESGGFWATVITFEGEAIFARFGTVQRDQPFPVTDKWGLLHSRWKSSISQRQYYEYVEEIRRNIALGIVYQANACRVLSTPFGGNSLDSLFSKILEENIAPYASFLRLPNLEIASASPELFLKRSGRSIQTSPIKGTQKSDSESLFGAKDQSENIMIVDLMRNDLGRICETGSIHVTDFLRSEDHPGVRHLVSDVQGTLQEGISWAKIFQGLLPAGSISGAPKISALEIIGAFEPMERGIYCGVIGWITGAEAQLAVAIRTFWAKERTIFFGTGAGITWPSDPHQEWRETQLKANRLIGIAGGMDDEGWQFGSGIFETLLMQEGVPLFFERHMDRAERSARELGIEVPPRDSIMRAISNLAHFPLARLRLQFGTQFSLSIEPYERNQSALTVQLCAGRPRAGIGGSKTFPYWENIDLLRSARFEGFDEVLLIDADGFVGEGATCNYLFNIEGRWFTPPVSRGVLPGVMRQIAIELGIAIEQEITQTDLEKSTSAIALSSLRIATPVGLLGDRDLIVGPEFDLIYETLWSEAQSDSVG
jgi:para-aminobenzoate synthetase component 1